MKRPLIYLKYEQREVVFHPLHHLSCHDCRKASLKVQSGGTETGEDHYEPINSPFTSLPILQPGGGARARKVGKGSLMSVSESSSASRGVLVSIVTVSLSWPMMASLAPCWEHSVFESGALVLCVWLPGVMGKPLCLVVTLELLNAPKACCCDTSWN